MITFAHTNARMCARANARRHARRHAREGTDAHARAHTNTRADAPAALFGHGSPSGPQSYLSHTLADWRTTRSAAVWAHAADSKNARIQTTKADACPAPDGRRRDAITSERLHSEAKRRADQRCNEWADWSQILWTALATTAQRPWVQTWGHNPSHGSQELQSQCAVIRMVYSHRSSGA
jgi:hypothetical protein